MGTRARRGLPVNGTCGNHQRQPGCWVKGKQEDDKGVGEEGLSPLYYGTSHEYDTLTRRFRKIGDEAEMVAGPDAIDRLIEDTFTRYNV